MDSFSNLATFRPGEKCPRGDVFECIEIGRRGARPVDGDVYYAARDCRDCVPLLSFYRHVPIVTAAHCSINVEL